MTRIHIVRPGNAKNAGPCLNKIIKKRDFISKVVLLDLPHDLMLKQRELQRQIALVTMKKPCSSCF